MQSSISFRLVLVPLAMCMATILACVPERAGGEESSAAARQPRQFLPPHQQQPRHIHAIDQLAKPCDAPARFEVPIGPNLSSQSWPQTPVMPWMSPGANHDSCLRNSGMPGDEFTRWLTDFAAACEPGREEQVAVKACHERHEYPYQVVKLSSAAAPARR